jgi:hypothetical protein
MKVPLIVSIFTLVGTAFGAIDLTPTTAERVLDGIKFQQLIFRDGEHSITYEPPHGWNYSGDSSQLKLTPPSVSQAQGVIEQSRLAAPQQFTEAVIKELQAKTLACVPPGSHDAAIVLEEESPVLVNRNATYEITVGYNFGNQEYQMSVLYVNLTDTQLRFRFAARKADFEKLHKSFRGSVFSWQWVEKPAVTVATRP